jgi:hypothetical protein
MRSATADIPITPARERAESYSEWSESDRDDATRAAQFGAATRVVNDTPAATRSNRRSGGAGYSSSSSSPPALLYFLVLL